MDKKDPKRDSKLFNIYNGSFVKNWMPNSIEAVKLDTHSECVDWQGVNRKYLTNIIVIGTNNIKLFVLFDDGTTQQLAQANIMDNIRTVNRLGRILLVQTHKKLFGMVYQNGFFRTIYMLSLQFLSLPPQYQSFIRIDSFQRYVLIVANQHIVMCMPKSQDFKQYENMQFEKVTEDVVWKASKQLEYFHSVYTYRVKDSVKDIHDVVLDVGSVYFLVREGQEFAVYCMRIESIVQPGGELIKKVYGMLPPAKHLVALSPTTQSHLLLFSPTRTIFLPTPSAQLQSIEVGIPLPQITSAKLIPLFNSVFVCTGFQIYHVQVSYETILFKQIYESKQKILNFCIVKDFVPNMEENVMMILQTACKVFIKSNIINTPIYRSLNSILDFHISLASKNIIAVEKDEVEEGNPPQHLNRLIVIKRTFKSIDKVYVNSKKSFFEKLSGQLEGVQSLPLHGWLAVKTEGQWGVYQDVMEDTTPLLKVEGIQSLDELNESVSRNSTKYFIGRKDDRLIVYDNSALQFETNVKKEGKLFIIEHLVAIVENFNNTILVLNLETKEQARIGFMASEDCIKMSIIKRKYSFKKLHTNFSLLLFCCYQKQLQIYEIDRNDISLLFRCLFINEGLPYLRNHLHDQRQQKPLQKTYLTSLSDPHYSLPLQQLLSPDPITDMLICQLTSMTILILQTSSPGEFFVYRFVPQPNDIGVMFRRIILPISRPSNDATLVEYNKNLVRFGNRVMVDDVVMEAVEGFGFCFRNAGFDVWIVNNEGRLKPVDVKGERISGKIVSLISESKSYVGVENSLEYYVAYTRDAVEMYDKEFNKKGSFSVQQGGSNCEIITAKMSQSFLGVSTYQHYREKSAGRQGFQSIKFQFTLFDIKAQTVRYDSNPMDQAVIVIRFTLSGKILLLSSTFLHIYEIRNKLQHQRTISYCQRFLISSVGFWYKQIKGQQPLHFFLTAGVFGGLSFFRYDDQKMVYSERWFEPLKCGLRDAEIFFYGKFLKAMIADHDRNLIVVNLKDDEMEKIADFNTGSRVNKMVRVEEGGGKGYDSICAAFVNGSIQMFTPVELKDQDISLLRFQTIITDLLPFVGGLNEREYRKLRQYCKSYKFVSKGNFVEYGMLELFMSLSKPLQKALLNKSLFAEEEIRTIIGKYCVY